MDKLLDTPFEYLMTIIGDKKTTENYLSVLGMSHKSILDLESGSSEIPLKVKKQIAYEYTKFNSKDYSKIERDYINKITNSIHQKTQHLPQIKKGETIIFSFSEFNDQHSDYLVTALEESNLNELLIEYNKKANSNLSKVTENDFYIWLKNNQNLKVKKCKKIYVSYDFNKNEKEITLTSI